MASIKEEGTRGERLSYKIRVCLGRDENGRQISKAMRWNPPEDMTLAKARKEAQRVAADWEAEQKEAFERQKTQQEGREPDYTFGQFVDEVWIPLCVRDGSHPPSTVAMYTNILKVMRPHFEELLLSGISGIQITQYLTWLRNDYRTQYGKPNFQGNAAVNYTDRDTPWTRIIEHKWFTFGKDEAGNDLPKTVISREYSSEWHPGDEPYYPVNDEKNGALYAVYRTLADQERKVLFGGHLGEYRYYDMDAVIAAALKKGAQVLGK